MVKIIDLNYRIQWIQYRMNNRITKLGWNNNINSLSNNKKNKNLNQIYL